MIHIAAVTQLRLDPEGRAYFRRKRADDKKPLEAMRCLKRRISDRVYRQLVADAQRAAEREVGTGPGGHCGASQESSAVDSHPHIDTSDQPLPGPAPTTLRPAPALRKRPLTPTRWQQKGAGMTLPLIGMSVRGQRQMRTFRSTLQAWHTSTRERASMGSSWASSLPPTSARTPGSRHPMGPLPH